MKKVTLVMLALTAVMQLPAQEQGPILLSTKTRSGFFLCSMISFIFPSSLYKMDIALVGASVDAIVGQTTSEHS